MTDSQHHHDLARAFVEELVRSGLVLSGLCADLLENLPVGALRAHDGENDAEALLDMLTGSVRPALDAAGSDVVTTATALIAATVDRALGDLKEAARLATPHEPS